MGTYITVDKTNPKTKDRFDTVAKGFNQRWPSNGQEPESILVCRTEEEIIDALGYALDRVKPLADDTGRTGKRITVRSGGHCYEGFVSNNPGGVIIDVSQYGGLQTNEDEKGDYVAPEGNRGFALDANDYKDYTQNVLRAVGASEPSVRALKSDDLSGYRFKFKILPGTLNWDGYVALYKQHGKTIPGGSCYNVGAGGHISGGGYGLLSRKHGLTTDWLSAVDVIIAVEDKSTDSGLKPAKVFASPTINPELFRLCCGAGGGNVGIITAYYFHDLPPAPQVATFVSYTVPWSQFHQHIDPKAVPEQRTQAEEKNKVGKVRFQAFLKSYADFFQTRSEDNEVYDGLFTLMHANHVSKGNLSIAIQYVPHNDVVKDTEKVLSEFVKQVFTAHEIHSEPSDEPFPVGHATVVGLETHLEAEIPAIKGAKLFDWLALTEAINDSGMNRRGKYKSAYLKAVSDRFAEGLYDALTRDAKYDGSGVDVSDSVVQIDSYGGRINRPRTPGATGVQSGDHFVADRRDGDDAVYQRHSVLKIQYQVYWFDPAEDDAHRGWLRDVYQTSLGDGYRKTPFPLADPGSKADPAKVSDYYEGGYINYPDVDMVAVLPLDKDARATREDWLTLYYGPDLPQKLIDAKLKYDPRNVFRHEMSIPPVVPNSRAQG